MVEDLLGYEFTDGEGLGWLVTGSPAWANGAYVHVEAQNRVTGERIKSVRSTAILRRSKELEESDSTRSILDKTFGKTYMP